MSIVTVKHYSCDFCHISQTDFPMRDRWFSVVSWRWPAIKSVHNCDASQSSVKHACNSCGYKIHETLAALGLEHDFVFVPQGDGMGRISVS